MRNSIYSVRHSVVQIYFALLTLILYCSVKITHVYNDTKYSIFYMTFKPNSTLHKYEHTQMTINTRKIALVGWALTWLVHSSWRHKRDPIISTGKEKHRKCIVECDVPLRELEGDFFQILVPVVRVEGNVWGGKCNGCCYSQLIVKKKELLGVWPSWDEWL
jgi:hypothetical protein